MSLSSPPSSSPSVDGDGLSGRGVSAPPPEENLGFMATHRPFVCADPSRYNPHLAALSSRNIRYIVDRSGEHPVIWVPKAFAELARRELEACDAELSRRPRRGWLRLGEAGGEAVSLDGLLGYLAVYAGLFRLLLWLASHQLLSDWQSRGCWNREAVLADGEWWRCLTALTLHADVQHILSNLLFGVFYGAFASARLGLGLSLLLMVGTGAGANALMTQFPNADHSSIGSSTMIYSLLGLLAARHTRLAWRELHREGGHGSLARLLPWLPLASAVALGALNGAAPGADVLAHTLGFLTGTVAGGLLEPDSPSPKARWQWLFGLLAIAMPVLAWLCAWR